MKVNTKILFVSSCILMVLAFYLNFNDFIMGSTPKLVSCCSSILFVVSCFYIIFIKKSNKMAMILIMYNSFIAIISFAALIEMECGVLAKYLIIFVIIAIPPFYGLNIFRSSYTFSFVMFVLSILLSITNVYSLIKKKKLNE